MSFAGEGGVLLLFSVARTPMFYGSTGEGTSLSSRSLRRLAVFSI